ncbi:uncharacterized protein LOC106661044 [Cimex lectularius]|uniref:CPR type cuticle protein n=1 Tax=Cimex lectularius TaxID=79782 RepID=A0A8I6SIE4_CIMLE|nr:uncharacterized protein LOC106661044 [Cimex lectularius]
MNPIILFCLIGLAAAVPLEHSVAVKTEGVVGVHDASGNVVPTVVGTTPVTGSVVQYPYYQGVLRTTGVQYPVYHVGTTGVQYPVYQGVVKTTGVHYPVYHGVVPQSTVHYVY